MTNKTKLPIPTPEEQKRIESGECVPFTYLVKMRYTDGYVKVIGYWRKEKQKEEA